MSAVALGGLRPAVYRRAVGAVERVFRGSVLLIEPQGAFRQLNGVAMLVWIVLDEPATRSQVVERLDEVADLVGPVAPDAIEDALGQMLDARILAVAGGS